MKTKFKLEVFITRLVLSVLLFILRSYSILIIWNWLLIKNIQQLNLPFINFGNACLLTMVFSFLLSSLIIHKPKIKNNNENEYDEYIYGFTSITVVIILVFIFSLF